LFRHVLKEYVDDLIIKLGVASQTLATSASRSLPVPKTFRRLAF
jgi:hypothetical protein